MNDSATGDFSEKYFGNKHQKYFELAMFLE